MTPRMDDRVKAIYFASTAEWRDWLREHHALATEVLVGFHKRRTGAPSLTWSESVDEALCFGWIDGVRKRLDDDRYTIRFTPRKPTSTWSAVNVAKMNELEAAGRMTAAGRAAFRRRREDRTATYSYEQRHLAAFDLAAERRFRANRKAWSYWQAQAPSYRKNATFWVMSAKRAETRERRLSKLIEDSAAGRTVPPLTPMGRR
jgi:uncharacterized protein YdeI (YjbR/CyaY-like superfamily)